MPVNTAFSPNPDFIAQLTGTGQPISPSTAATYVASGNTDITAILRTSTFCSMTTATGNSTIFCNTIFAAGTLKNVQINNDAVGARTITFGGSNGFRATGTVVGTNSKAILVQFISDGVTLNEIARSVGAV